jgi:hypothetical protein
MTPPRPDDRALEDLRRELTSLGMVVVSYGDRLQVRLATLEHIVVRVDGGVLRCEARVGAVSFVRAMWTLVATTAIGIPALLLGTGIAPATLAASFLLVASLVFNGTRYLLADGCITRIQHAWATVRARATGEWSLRATPESPLLGEGSPLRMPMDRSSERDVEQA